MSRNERYLILYWRRNKPDAEFLLSHATVAHSLRMAKRLRTMRSKHWSEQVSIIPEELIRGVGELSEVKQSKARKQVLIENFDKLAIRHKTQ